MAASEVSRQKRHLTESGDKFSDTLSVVKKVSSACSFLFFLHNFNELATRKSYDKIVCGQSWGRLRLCLRSNKPCLSGMSLPSQGCSSELCRNCSIIKLLKCSWVHMLFLMLFSQNSGKFSSSSSSRLMSSDCSTHTRFYKALGLAFSQLQLNKMIHFMCKKCSVIKDMNLEFLCNSNLAQRNELCLLGSPDPEPVAGSVFKRQG